MRSRRNSFLARPTVVEQDAAQRWLLGGRNTDQVEQGRLVALFVGIVKRHAILRTLYWQPRLARYC